MTIFLFPYTPEVGNMAACKLQPEQFHPLLSWSFQRPAMLDTELKVAPERFLCYADVN